VLAHGSADGLPPVPGMVASAWREAGWRPPIQAADSWRPVELLGESATSIDRADLHSSLDGNDGLIRLPLQFVHPQYKRTARLVCNDASITLQWRDTQTFSGLLATPA
jgi:beta-mannosidase